MIFSLRIVPLLTVIRLSFCLNVKLLRLGAKRCQSRFGELLDVGAAVKKGEVYEGADFADNVICAGRFLLDRRGNHRFGKFDYSAEFAYIPVYLYLEVLVLITVLVITSGVNMKKLSGFLGLVLSAGIAVSCATFSSLPPLHVAAQNGNLNKVQQLVESGADINAWSFGDTALERAALRGRLEVVEYLLSRGARDPERAFRNALRNNHVTIVRLMVDGGHIDVNHNALAFYAIFNDSQLPFEQRLHNVRNIAGGTLNSPLLLALVDAENYQQTIEFFNINLEDRVDALGNSILHIAAMRNNLDLAAYLLERNFDVNVLNNNNHTALFYNITSFGPSVNWNSPVIEDETTVRINYIGDMPFYSDPLGVRMRRAKIGVMLLDAGINVNQQDLSGWSVLHFAGASSYAGGASTMEFFIEKGADQGLETNLGRTAADILAMRNGK